MEAQIRAAQELPLHPLAGRYIQGGGQGQGHVHEEAGWPPLGADDLNFHDIFSLHAA